MFTITRPFANSISGESHDSAKTIIVHTVTQRPPEGATPFESARIPRARMYYTIKTKHQKKKEQGGKNTTTNHSNYDHANRQRLADTTLTKSNVLCIICRERNKIKMNRSSCLVIYKQTADVYADEDFYRLGQQFALPFKNLENVFCIFRTCFINCS